MNSKALIDMLAAFPDTLTAAVQGLSDEDLRWKPEKKMWSILEIVCHLGDEEVEDFRLRLKLTLQDPAEPWPGIDPEGWATDRKYNERDLGESLTRFTEERNASMQWLGTLTEPDWTLQHHHALLGSIPAGSLLAAWVAHDALHLRQIAKRRYQLIQEHAGEYSLSYAGEWPT